MTNVQYLCEAASQASLPFSRITSEDLYEFLLLIGTRLEEHRSEIVPLAHEESNLPLPRLEGELTRTISQFKLFAEDVKSERWTSVTTTEAIPERAPLPRPQLVRKLIPIGPVAVFGASNFPLAFSVAGGDTASALAAKCPVIAKIHPAHPHLSRLIASIISACVVESGLPAGVFAVLDGSESDARELVENPHITAVGFTGSQRVGRILMDIASNRPNPIPVFAEMGSTNPVFVMPGGEMTFANGYAASLTMGVGQFCTNPGIAVGVDSAEWSAAKAKVRADIEASPMGKMLTDLIEAAYLARAASLTTNSIGDLYGIPQGPQVYEVTAKEFLNNAELHEEVFGPFGVIVTAESYEEMVQVAEVIQGQLTATIFAVNNTHRTLIDILTTRVGRLIFDGFPTGVEVCEAMQHGGPYPATSDSRFTSVGNHAIARWLRPICLQNPPSWLD